ncbi:MAG: CDF family Co(II)/Ni(II) efflux transporter DmeF [Deltaproteobacteria bacterium]|nr:CDF family Co(II)/Ni(II) efflux transporter DmeF [Deltaproteobacteria bacterium]
METIQTNCSTGNGGSDHRQNERVTLFVVIITLVMMVAEIVAGILSGSMALLSDGIHMGTHSVALFITLSAYIIARRQRGNPDFAFGTGKVGVLGGYTNAILLIIAGLAMAYESIERIIDPVAIHYNEALIVAVIGLFVNLVSALILGKGESGHGHSHGHDHEHEHTDHNLRAAYLHVLTDALTSILAIAALLIAKLTGMTWADPAVGILGAIVVIHWAVGLIRQTGSILLDRGDFSDEISRIRERLEDEQTRICDIHIWQISENERSLIVGLETSSERTSADYHQIIQSFSGFEHATVEVNQISY